MEQEQRTTRTRSVRVEEYDMVLAQNITQLRNALVEKGILGPEHGANSDGHSIFSTCIVCDKTYPSLRSQYDDLHRKVSLLEKTIRDERREREQLDVIIAHKIAELTNERNVLMSYTSDIHKNQAYSTEESWWTTILSAATINHAANGAEELNITDMPDTVAVG